MTSEKKEDFKEKSTINDKIGTKFVYFKFVNS